MMNTIGARKLTDRLIIALIFSVILTIILILFQINMYVRMYERIPTEYDENLRPNGVMFEM